MAVPCGVLNHITASFDELSAAEQRQSVRDNLTGVPPIIPAPVNFGKDQVGFVGFRESAKISTSFIFYTFNASSNDGWAERSDTMQQPEASKWL